MSDQPQPTTDERMWPVKSPYRVELAASQPACKCDNCKQWTVTHDLDGEPTEWHSSWEGLAGKEHAEDLCGDLNNAYDAGHERCMDHPTDKHFTSDVGPEIRYWCPIAQRMWAESKPCDKLDGCWKGLGHEGECEDDIPF